MKWEINFSVLDDNLSSILTGLEDTTGVPLREFQSLEYRVDMMRVWLLYRMKLEDKNIPSIHQGFDFGSRTRIVSRVRTSQFWIWIDSGQSHMMIYSTMINYHKADERPQLSDPSIAASS